MDVQGKVDDDGNDALLVGILDKKYPISVSDASIVIHVKLKGKYRSLGYKYFADAADDQKNISYILDKFPGTRKLRSYGLRKTSPGPHQITPEFLKDRDAYMKTLIEESKKSLKETVAMDGLHEVVANGLKAVDFSGIDERTLYTYQQQVDRYADI